MRRGSVLDAYAVLAFLQGEESGKRVAGLLRQAAAGKTHLYVSMINVAEVFYRLCRVGRGAVADDFVDDLKRSVLPVETASATDTRVVAAARLKARFPISLADAFAAALAIEKEVPVVTGDPEFRPLQTAGLLEVDWLQLTR